MIPPLPQPGNWIHLNWPDTVCVNAEVLAVETATAQLTVRCRLPMTLGPARHPRFHTTIELDQVTATDWHWPVTAPFQCRVPSPICESETLS